MPFGNGIAVKSNVRVAPEPVTWMGVVTVPARFRIVAVMLRSVTPSPVTTAVTPITGGVSPATSMVPRTATSCCVMVTDGTPGLRVKVELAARMLPTSSDAVMRSTWFSVAGDSTGSRLSPSAQSPVLTRTTPAPSGFVSRVVGSIRKSRIRRKVGEAVLRTSKVTWVVS